MRKWYEVQTIDPGGHCDRVGGFPAKGIRGIHVEDDLDKALLVVAKEKAKQDACQEDRKAQVKLCLLTEEEILLDMTILDHINKKIDEMKIEVPNE